MALLVHSPELHVAPQIPQNPIPNSRKLHSFKPYTKSKAIRSKRKHGSRSSKEEEEEKQNYYLNMGYAIRTLREEFPDLFYKELSFDIYSVWQPVENVVMVRWTVHGIPRVPWESHGRFDGTSEYKLDKEGKIYEHRVDNIALNSPPRFKVLGVEALIQSLGCPSTPRPTYFEISSSIKRK